MGRSSRRFYAVVAVGCVLVAVAVASVVVLAFSGTSKAAPTKAEYFAKVARVCRLYAPKLDRIPEADIAEPGNIIQDVSLALPLVKGELEAVRAIPQPKELRPRLQQWFAVHDQGIADLEAALRAGRRVDLRTLIVAYGRFIVQGPKARQLGAEMGIPSTC